MNTASFKIEKNYINLFFKTFLFSFFYFAQIKVHAIDIDLSRRQTQFDKIENERMPASLPPQSEEQKSNDLIDAFKKIVNPVEVSEELVIIQTEKGYIPSVVKFVKGKTYKIHVVNLDLSNKNTSFVMDSFSQVHNTVYGSMKTFSITPQIDGVFSYQSPETGFVGKAVVVNESQRKIASEDGLFKKGKKLKPVLQPIEEKIQKEELPLALPTTSVKESGSEELMH